MAANLYAKSIFGEDALANLSIERSATDPNAHVIGHIRIRAKSQVRLRFHSGILNYEHQLVKLHVYELFNILYII